MLPLLIFIVFPHFSSCGFLGISTGISYKPKTNCGLNEVYRTCGPKCPPTCDTLKDTICCEVACVAGCFCADGYMLESKNGPKKCLPIAQCPNPGILKFEEKSVEFLENTKVAKIHVIRINGSYGKVTVRWRIVGPPPYKGYDGLLVFPDGVTSQYIEIPIQNNDQRNPDVTFQIELFNPTNKAEIVEDCNTIKVTILDDDMKPGYPEMEKTDIVILENVSPVKVNVIRVGGSDGKITVKYKTIPGTAKEYKDFTPKYGELVFNEGETMKSIYIDIIDDNVREETETFRVQLFDPKAAPGVRNFKPLGVRMTTTITIKCDDMRPGFLELEKSSIRVIETIGKVQIKIVRHDGTDGQIRCRYKTVDITATANLDFEQCEGEVVFEEGEEFKIVDVPILDDNIREKTEIFRFELYDPSAGPDVINFRQRGSILSTEITIIDNDMKPGYLIWEESIYVVTEGAGTLKICVSRLEGSDGEIQVFYKTVAKTAQAGQDFQLATGKLVFKEGEILKCITIQITNDNVREPTEVFEVILYDPSAAPGVINFRGIGSRKKTTVTIQDDDMQPGSLELDESIYEVSENVGIVKIRVVRVGGSDGTIRVFYKTVAKTAEAVHDFQPTTGVLIFKEGETVKYISVRIINDNVREPTEIFEVVLFDSTAEPDVLNFRGIGGRTTTTIKILDDDMKPGRLELEKPSFIVPENIGIVRVGVVRVGGSDGEIRVFYKTVPKTALAEEDFHETTGELVFKEGETLKYIFVQVINDQVREATEIFEVVIFDPSNAPGVINFRGLGPRNSATITITDDDMNPGILEVEKTEYTVSEGIGTIKICVVREDGKDGEIRVLYKTVSKTAQDGKDFQATSGELIFKEGDTLKCIYIKIINDDIREPTESFDVVLYDTKGGAGVINFRGLGARRTTTVTINDDDMKPGLLEIQKQEYVVSEGVGSLKICVERVEGSDGEVRVFYKTVAKTAQAGQDFQQISGELIFKEGETLKCIFIQIINDNTREPTESFDVILYDSKIGPDGVNFRGLGARRTTIVTINDDDMQPGILELEKPTYMVSEGIGTLKVCVVRREGSDGEIRVFFKTIAKTAQAGRDFQQISGELIFQEGETQKCVSIQIIDDNTREPTESFDVVLYDSKGGPGVINFRGLGRRRKTTVTIIDDDMNPGIFEVEKSEYTVLEGIGTLKICVVRREGSDGEIRVFYKTVSKTAEAGKDFQAISGELIFKEGETLKCVFIQIIDDDTRESTESFDVVIYDSKTGPDVINFRGLGPRRTTTVTINDDDMKPGLLEVEKPEYTVSEGVGSLKICVVRVEGSDGEVRVFYKTVSKTAQAGQDFQQISGELIFKEGETLKCVSIKIINDNTREPTESFDVVLYDSKGGPDVINFRGLGARRRATVIINDDDITSGELEMEKANIVVPEDVGVAQITVVRIGGNDGVLYAKYTTVDGTAKAGSDYTFTSGIIELPNGVVRQTLTIPIVDDNEKEPMEYFQVRLYTDDENPGSIRSTTVTIIDNDETPGVFEFRATSTSVREGDGKVILTVIRMNGVDGSVSLNWRTIDGTAKEGLDYKARQGSITFNEGETEKSFAIEIIDDLIKEADKQFFVGLFDPTRGSLGHNNMITVTIYDDDEDGNIQTYTPVIPTSIQTFFTQSIIRVPRGSSVVQFHVRRSGDLKLLRFYLETQDGTARAGIDYRRTKGEIDFAKNEIELTIEVKLIVNKDTYGTKFFIVKIMNPSEGIILPGKDVLTVVINNDPQSKNGETTYKKISNSDYVVSGTNTGNREIYSQTSIGKGSYIDYTSGVQIPNKKVDYSRITNIKTTGNNAGYTGTSGIKIPVSNVDYRITDVKTTGIKTGFTGTSGIKIPVSNVDYRISDIKTQGISGSYSGTSGYIKTSGTYSGSVSERGDIIKGETYGRRIDQNLQVTQGADVQQNDFSGFGNAGTTKKIICPNPMTFKKCATRCPNTCATLNKHSSCKKTCVDACFCPDGLVIENLRTLRCIPPSHCKATEPSLGPKGNPGIGGGLLGGLGGLGGLLPI